MTKQQIQQRVLQNGKPLDLDKFTWDQATKTFSTNENSLVLDFLYISNVNFKTGSFCIFKTGRNCTFKTDSSCNFKTGSDCTFDTGSDCNFKTGSFCIFKTGSDCTFDTRSDCTFDTGLDCVVFRKDIFKIINLNEIEGDRKQIELNDRDVKGYTTTNQP